MEEELIRYIAENLVNDPSAVKVNRREAGRTTILELNVAQDDMGRVIGKSGRVANAMRTLLRASADNQRGGRIVLEIE
ncbi:KH domain-containing protein [Phototrophicus methaneseepsis]|uniref:RNA-binding protein KhpA n=1 Tax=Phototrophicus methaneseepsis TaxID=2710758 RepID=A0A7S8E5W3_9CHLR|nr:KH domain-containing protein [Phototrophicus methaneseepsis]QPC80854.1 KH domain-containing protein [Phototrophicus methaneseepsis]